MKKLILLAIVALGITGCTMYRSFDSQTVLISSRLNSNSVIVVEGCEYFVVKEYAAFAYVHKGNCKNLIHPENK